MTESVGDELAIQRILFDYAWACDNNEWDRLRSVFTDSAQLDYSSTGGPAGGPDVVIAWLQSSLSQLRFIHHSVSNFQIDVAADQATGRAMFSTSFGLAEPDHVLQTGGYYDLELVRGDDGWKIQRLVEDNRWMTRP